MKRTHDVITIDMAAADEVGKKVRASSFVNPTSPLPSSSFFARKSAYPTSQFSTIMCANQVCTICCTRPRRHAWPPSRFLPSASTSPTRSIGTSSLQPHTGSRSYTTNTSQLLLTWRQQHAPFLVVKITLLLQSMGAGSSRRPCARVSPVVTLCERRSTSVHSGQSMRRQRNNLGTGPRTATVP